MGGGEGRNRGGRPERGRLGRSSGIIFASDMACDGCGKKFSIEHVISCPNGGLVHVRHNDAAKERGALEAVPLSQAL